MALLTTSDSSVLAKSVAARRKEVETSAIPTASLGPSSPYPSLKSHPAHLSTHSPSLGFPKPSPLCESRLLGNVSGRACAGDTMKARDQVGWEGNKGLARASGPSQETISSNPYIPL